MSIEEQIGIKIRNLRNQNGLTQEELADRTVRLDAFGHRGVPGDEPFGLFP